MRVVSYILFISLVLLGCKKKDELKTDEEYLRFKVKGQEWGADINRHKRYFARLKENNTMLMIEGFDGVSKRVNI